MADFYSRTNMPATIPQPECPKIVPTYGKVIDDNGKVKVVETGKTNLYEKIQASKDDTLIYNILDRFKAGDISVLQRNQGYYADLTEMPKTLAEAQQSLIIAENYFNSLPLDVRKEFNHSFSEFLASASSGKLAERHSYFKTQEQAQDLVSQEVQQPVVPQQPVANQTQTTIQTPQVTTAGTIKQVTTGGINE